MSRRSSTFTVKEAASVKAGNPNEKCGLAESNFVLPAIVYDSNGANQNLLDVSGELDLSFIEAGAPKVVMEMTNLADGFTLSNTDAGKAFNIENPGLKTDKVLVKVIPFDLKLLDLNWTGCSKPDTLVSWHSQGRITVTVNTQLRLQIEGLVDVELRPGFSTGVSGDYTKLTLVLPDPNVSITYADNVLAGVHINVSKEINGTIRVLQANNGTTSFSLPITFHVAKQEAGIWLDFLTGIPCGVEDKVVKFLYVTANIVPHRKKLAKNEFTVDGGTWVATADPFGAGSGLSALATGVDVIDSFAGLFTSPYPHGVQTPTVVCKKP
jgi:hypothetical protein